MYILPVVYTLQKGYDGNFMLCLYVAIVKLTCKKGRCFTRAKKCFIYKRKDTRWLGNLITSGSMPQVTLLFSPQTFNHMLLYIHMEM
jgi:hypothetical protein